MAMNVMVRTHPFLEACLTRTCAAVMRATSRCTPEPLQHCRLACTACRSTSALSARLRRRQWTHLEQQSFPMSEAEYMEKLNNIAFYLGCASLPHCVHPDARIGRMLCVAGRPHSLPCSQPAMLVL